MASQNKGGTKLRRSGKGRTVRKYSEAFQRHVLKFGRWRGAPATLAGRERPFPKWK